MVPYNIVVLKKAINKAYYPEIRAALIAFGFVFIHPFEDGNSTSNRFLIHDILAHDGIVPRGLIIPVSALMLNNVKDYYDILESYSKPLMKQHFIKLTDDEITKMQTVFREIFY